MGNLLDKLSAFRRNGIISDIDLELCRFIKERDKDAEEPVLLAACVLSYLYREGDVCLLLEKYAGKTVFEDPQSGGMIMAPELEKWRDTLSKSAMVGAPGEFKPMILDESGRLYLHKLWHYENELANGLMEKSGQRYDKIDHDLLRDGLSRLFPTSNGEVDWQKVAAALTVRNKLSIISGGPGTGKTSTVVRILALLLEQAERRDESLHIALTAPTGKAAARLKSSMVSSKGLLEVEPSIRESIPEEAKTLHQLLGARRHSSAFRHDEENPLPYDLVVVDEASMVDQALMSKLMNALLDNARLILLGDKDQLASVEAGSVLGDICDLDSNRFSEDTVDFLRNLSLKLPEESAGKERKSLSDNITLLTKSYRFDAESGIARLGSSINEGSFDRTWDVLQSAEFADARFLKPEELEDALESRIISHFQTVMECDTPKRALKAFGNFRVLCAHRRGPWGVDFFNQKVEQILQRHNSIPKYDRWYAGKPVIVNVNDYTLGLNNGDIGLCLPDGEGEQKIHFLHEDSVRTVSPGRLPDHSTAFALTVHKSQGSEFDEIFMVLPNSPSKVLSRELLYTAVTRARTNITISGTEKVLRKAVEQQLQRSSGLRKRLWD